MSGNQGQAEIPLYQSHKQVRALKVRYDPSSSKMLLPVDLKYLAFEMPSEWFVKHEPKALGYFVVYDGGYKSWSPVEAFEGGYTQVS